MIRLVSASNDSLFLLSARVCLGEEPLINRKKKTSTRPHTESRTSSHTVSPRVADGVVYCVLFKALSLYMCL